MQHKSYLISYFLSFIGFIIVPRAIASYFWFHGIDNFCLSSMNVVILTGILSTNIIHALSLYLVGQQKHHATLKHLFMLMPLLPTTADIISCFGFSSDCHNSTKYFWLAASAVGLMLHICNSIVVVAFSLIDFATKSTITPLDDNSSNSSICNDIPQDIELLNSNDPDHRSSESCE